MGKPNVQPLTYEERKRIEKGIKLGLSCGRIAVEIGRSKNGVVSEVRRGGKHQYTAKEGQRICDEMRKKKYESLSLLKKKQQPPLFDYKQRIENLEMQVEILHETIKELLYK